MVRARLMIRDVIRCECLEIYRFCWQMDAEVLESYFNDELT